MTKVEKSDLYRQLFILQSAGKIAPDAQEVAQAMWQLHQKEVIPKLTLVHSQATCFLREAS